jgi:DNA polymerase III epsilon subunit-like protein|nr:3'-5' exonuclease [Neorhizobium tomejilense]
MEFDIRYIALEGEFSAIDVEADGWGEQRPVEISLVRFSAGQPVEEHHWMINPERGISPYVADLHGITDQMVAGAPVFSDIRSDVASLVEGSVLVAHCIKDDMRLLSTVFPEAPLLPSLMFDTLRMAKNLVKEIGRFNLDTLSEALEIEVPENRLYPVHTSYPSRGVARHSTGVDAYLAGAAFVSMARRIDLSPKQVKHIGQSVRHVLNPRQIEAIRELVDTSAVSVRRVVAPRV